MDKEKIVKVLKKIGEKLVEYYLAFRGFCNKNVFPTSLILIGLFILLLNNINIINSYYLFTLGMFFILLFFHYNRLSYYSFIGAHLLTFGLYIVLLFSDMLPEGGMSAVVLAIGLGFIVFYILEAKWTTFWPLVPGLTISAFGLLIYLHNTGVITIDFLDVLGSYWPLVIVIFGIVSLYYNSTMKLLQKVKQKFSK